MNRFAILLLASLAISCSYHSPIYGSHGEWTGSGVSGMGPQSTASLDWTRHPDVIKSIDGHKLGDGYKKTRLLPGMHVMEYADYPAEFGAHPRGTIRVNMKKGHSYEFRLKLCFWCMPRKHAGWIEDTTTGEVAWGKRPDWPSWFL